MVAVLSWSSDVLVFVHTFFPELVEVFESLLADLFLFFFLIRPNHKQQ